MTSYLVTGAARGIGLGLVKEILKKPDTTVFALVRGSSKIDELKAIKSSRLHIVTADISNPSEVDEVVKQVEKLTSSLDVIILSAALLEISLKTPLELTESPEAFKEFVEESNKIMYVNTYSQLYVANKFRPLLSKGEKKKIVFVSSGLGHGDWVYKAGHQRLTAYSMGKAALNLMVAQLGATLRHEGFTVLALCPGIVNSSRAPLEEVEENYKIFFDAARRVNPTFKGILQVEEACTRFMEAVEFYGPMSNGRFISANGTHDVFA